MDCQVAIVTELNSPYHVLNIEEPTAAVLKDDVNAEWNIFAMHCISDLNLPLASAAARTL